MPWIIVGAILVAYGMCCLINAINSSPFDMRPILPRGVTDALLGASLGSVPGALLLRAWLRRQIDPNSSFPNRPRLPHGSPPALLAHQGASGTDYSIAPVDGGKDYAAGDWVSFHFGQLRLPHICCGCEGPPTTAYSRVFKIFPSSQFVPLPLCANCASRVRSKWWRTAGQTVAGSLAICWGAMAFLHVVNDFDRWAIFVILSSVISLIGILIVPRWMAEPYRMRSADRDRGICRIRTRNPEFDRRLEMETRRYESRPLSSAVDAIIRK